MKVCSCGRPIKQKYFKKCIHCQKVEKRRRREQRQLTKNLRDIRGDLNPALEVLKR